MRKTIYQISTGRARTFRERTAHGPEANAPAGAKEVIAELFF